MTKSSVKRLPECNLGYCLQRKDRVTSQAKILKANEPRCVARGAAIALPHFLADRTVGPDPMYAQGAGIVIRDEKIFARAVHAVVDWTRTQRDWLPMQPQSSGRVIDAERRQMMLASCLSRSAI